MDTNWMKEMVARYAPIRAVQMVHAVSPIQVTTSAPYHRQHGGTRRVWVKWLFWVKKFDGHFRRCVAHTVLETRSTQLSQVRA